MQPSKCVIYEKILENYKCRASFVLNAYRKLSDGKAEEFRNWYFA